MTAPVRVPEAVGMNVTLMLHEAVAASVAPQEVVFAKLPVVTMLEMFISALPVLVNTTVCAALVVETTWALNIRDVSENEAIGALPIPGTMPRSVMSKVSPFCALGSWCVRRAVPAVGDPFVVKG